MSTDNLFKANDILKLQNDLLRDEIESLKLTVLKYKESMLEIYNDQLKQKTDKKEYVKSYFQTVTKLKTRHCDVCNCNYKTGSFSNHLKSKIHNENLNPVLKVERNPKLDLEELLFN